MNQPFRAWDKASGPSYSAFVLQANCPTCSAMMTTNGFLNRGHTLDPEAVQPVPFLCHSCGGEFMVKITPEQLQGMIDDSIAKGYGDSAKELPGVKLQ